MYSVLATAGIAIAQYYQAGFRMKGPRWVWRYFYPGSSCHHCNYSMGLKNDPKMRRKEAILSSVNDDRWLLFV